MKRRRRVNVGEPLDAFEVATRPVDVRRVLNDLATLGRIGAMLNAPPQRTDPNVIEMREVAPGVFARAENPRRRPAPGPLGKLQRLERAVAELRRGFHAR